MPRTPSRGKPAPSRHAKKPVGTPVGAKNGKARKTNRKGKPKRPLPVRILLWFGGALLVLIVLGAAAFAFAYSSVRVPDANADFLTNTTTVYYSDGVTPIGSFQVQNRQSVAYAEMNKHAIDAIVAAENRSFWTDPGISPLSMLRAGWTVARGGDVTGASTITQQYIKVVYLTQEKTMSRKLEEILLAAKMGRELTKEQILERYLNAVYFGRGAYGLEAASQAYFGKPQSDLTLAEATALVCIINNPSQYDPARGDSNAADLLGRYQYALNGMVELGTLKASERDQAYYKLPKFPKVKTDSRLGGPKGFLLTMVQNELSPLFTEQQLNGGGLHITTTFDKTAQDQAVKSVQDMTLQAAQGNKKKAADLHASLVSIDNQTGGVLALYGGPDFVANSRNWATTPRAAASTFKTYALTAALRDGWSLQDHLRGNTFTPPGDSKPVRNDSGEQWGSPTLLAATTHSINTAFVDLVIQLPDGPNQVVQAATDAGAPHNATWDTSLNNRIALGTAEVSPYYQAAAYSTFANQGMHLPPHVVASVVNAQGTNVYDAGTAEDLRPQQTIEMDVATDVTYALSKVAQDGTGRRAADLGYPVAGKTGTGSVPGPDGRPKTVVAWFVGFTKQITTSVLYVAGDDGFSSLDAYGSFYGSGYPARTWLAYMKVAMQGQDKLDFAPPVNRPPTHDVKTPTPKPTVSVTPTAPTPGPQPTADVTEQPTTEPTTAPTSAPPESKPPPATEKPPSSGPPETPG